MKQIEKNTVPAKNQLKKNNSVTYEQKEGNGLRVMFVGNSITRHGVLPDIGWHWDWGMAASAKEKDYVHLLIKKINETNPDAAYCICQVSEWEQGYKNGSEFLELYKEERDFQADLIIFRMIENCPWKDFDSDVFYKEYQNLIDYLNPTGKAKIILTTAFWKHTGDDTIRKVAKERNYPLVELSHLGEEDKMKAIGLFEHAGVAWHPGDEGMRNLAERLLAAWEKEQA
jgi:hypothetical protein